MLLKLLLLLVVLAPVPAPPRPDPLGLGYLGVRAALDADTDLTLSEVVAGTPAARAGLQVGDTLVRVGRYAPRRFEDLREYVSGLRPGTRQEVELRRGSRTVRLSVEIGAAPPAGLVIDPFAPFVPNVPRRLPVIPPNR